MIRFTLPDQVFYAGAGLALLFTGLLVWWNSFRTGPALSRRGAILLGLAWTALGTFEYWILGPHSALGRPDEYNVTIPWLYHLTHCHDGGTYMHGYSGGVDATAGVACGVQYLSVERLLVGSLPLWLAIAALNIGAIGLGYAGGYRLARSLLGLTRGKAAVVGLVASGTHISNLAWAAGGIGWAIALMPWGVYFLARRTDRPRYFAGVLLLAVLYSGSTGIIHSLPAFFVGLLAVACLMRPARPGRFLAGCILFGLVCIFNWSDVLYALVQVSPESARANLVRTTPSLLDHLQLNSDVLVLPAGLVALGVFLLRRNRPGVLTVAVFWLAFTSGHLLGALNWRATGSSLLAAYRWDLISDGCFVVGLLVIGRVLALADWSAARSLGPLRLPPLGAVYFAGLAVLALAHHKAVNLLNYRFYGGTALFTSAPVLPRADWRAAEPFRVVTEYGLFAPNTASAYRLDTFDGSVQAFTLRRNRYYGLAVLQPRNPAPHTHVHFLQVPAGAPLGATADLAALRVANVRYVLSARPLPDPDLTVVAQQAAAGPAEGWLHHWAPREAARTVYVHEIAGAWPRVFVPAEIRVSGVSADEPAFYQELLTEFRVPGMLVARDDAGGLSVHPPVAGAVRLETFQLVPDGFDLTLAPGNSAASPGAVVVNAPYSRLWRAIVRGQPRMIVPVNGIAMAVIVEPGDRDVRLRYARRTLADALLGRAGP